MEKVDCIGLIIPDGCKNIYVFRKEEDFIEQIQNRKMLPLYGDKKTQKDMSLFVAYVP